MQGYLESRPQFARGALGLAVIDRGVRMKLLAIWFCVTEAWQKERRRTGSHIGRAAGGRHWLPVVMDDRVGWRKKAFGGGGGGGGERGASTKVDLVVVLSH